MMMKAPLAIERAALRKASLRLVPFLSFLYLLCMLDRSNLGNAHSSMIKSVGISDAEYAASVSIFYIGYVLFEVPSNCFMEAKKWIPRIMFTWGLVSMGMGAINSSSSLLLMRFLLGVAEAGFFPSVLYYLTLWFPEEKRALHIAISCSNFGFYFRCYFFWQFDARRYFHPLQL